MHRSVALPTSSLTAGDLRIDRLGEAMHASPIRNAELFVDEDDAVLAHSDAKIVREYLAAGLPLPAFEPAGPRDRIYFDPTELTAGIVTCGGLCPGINDVIRAIAATLSVTYGVRRVLGFRFGYGGLLPEARHKPIVLDSDTIRRIHEDGGTLLASSRGPQDPRAMVDGLRERGVKILFTIGGDGTLRGASALHEEIRRQGLDIAIVGVPKTIDNDLMWVEKTFGFATAVEEARRSIMGARTEAEGAFNGVGLVKLMGRHSGFIAAHAALACSDVSFCLVPEVPLVLDGKRGFLAALEAKLREAEHAVIVVAEGAGQSYFDGDPGRDVSGNRKLRDIGALLRERIIEELPSRGIPVAMKYIDPSYLVRSLPANAEDSALCLMLGQYAAHAAMAGRTNLLVGYWNQRFTHIPLGLATGGRKGLDPRGELWEAVLGATGQPASWG